MSKPTLLDHLGHLKQKNLVLREPKDIHVFYRVNDKEVGRFKDFTEKALRNVKELEEEEKTLFSLPIDKQVEEFLKIVAIRNLAELKTKILFKSDGKFEDGLTLS
jgi:hypothetical protein